MESGDAALIRLYLFSCRNVDCKKTADYDTVTLYILLQADGKIMLPRIPEKMCKQAVLV